MSLQVNVESFETYTIEIEVWFSKDPSVTLCLFYIPLTLMFIVGESLVAVS